MFAGRDRLSDRPCAIARRTPRPREGAWRRDHLSVNETSMILNTCRGVDPGRMTAAVSAARTRHECLLIDGI